MNTFLRRFPSENVPISRKNLVKPSQKASVPTSHRLSAARKKSSNSSSPAFEFLMAITTAGKGERRKEMTGSYQVPRQSCELVPRQSCRSVPVEDCREVPRQECKAVPREVCAAVPTEECRAVTR